MILRTAAPIAEPPTAFGFWAELIIPSIIGLATIVVGVAAVVTSVKAGQLARSIEGNRIADANDRHKEADRQRILAMAQAEAKSLRRWVLVALSDMHWEYRNSEDVSGPTGSTSRDEAQVELEQSLVPGADDLFHITALEIRHYYGKMPDAVFMPDKVGNDPAYPRSALLDTAVPRVRRERILDRISAWAREPAAHSPSVRRDLTEASRDIEGFMDYRRSLEIDGLRPFREIKMQAGMHCQRIAFLKSRGLIPADYPD
ncbi:MAG: hypothetical protein EPO52_12490 [Herbiconiux sp.]|uniref:hypothetical protein n=1 Tax=Herbiconiux sp. TaxID=1871186 RepID=UPI0011FF8EAB|nr:hypothetical protein [Herbiconiux sp.]TAJ47311.1 MAG: hypothetical protein EPO52_12490 [Herbiconiux sp.]